MTNGTELAIQLGWRMQNAVGRNDEISIPVGLELKEARFSDIVHLWVIKIKKSMILCACRTPTCER